MKAISTRYHGPTNTRGARISATADGWGRVYVDLNDASSHEAARWPAVEALIRKGYKYRRSREEFIAGTLANGDVVFVFANDHRFVFDGDAVQS